MRITIEGSTWTNQRGYGRFLREIVGAALRLGTRHQFTLVADTSLPQSFALEGLEVKRVPLRVAAGAAASADGYRSPRDLWAMSRALTSCRSDCICFPTVYSYVPVWTRLPVVVGIHDVIAERLPGHVFRSRRARWFWSVKVGTAARQAARVFTVSTHASAGLVEALHVDPARIRIVGEAPAAIFAPGADRQPGIDALRAAGLAADARFFLYVGGIAPHKNLMALVDAVDRIGRVAGAGDVRLLIVGDFEQDAFLSAYPALRAHADARATMRAVFTGRLEDSVVAALMRLAVALVLPSFDEGFGLPAIEAAACGGAVIATCHSAIPEVLGDAALYIDPYDPTSLESAMTRLLHDPALRAELGVRASARIGAWTWETAARQLIRVFEELAS